MDGAVLAARPDDTEEVVRERLEAYERQTRPVLKFFEAQGTPPAAVKADDLAPEALFERISQVLRFAAPGAVLN